MFEHDDLLPLDGSKIQLVRDFFNNSQTILMQCIESKEYDSIPKAVSVLNIQIGLTELEDTLTNKFVMFRKEKDMLNQALLSYEPHMITALIQRLHLLRKKYQDSTKQSINPKSQDFDLINLLNMQSLILMRKSRKFYDETVTAYSKFIAVLISLSEFEKLMKNYLVSLEKLKEINLELEYFVSYCQNFNNVTIFVKEFGNGIDSINEKTRIASRLLARAKAYQRKIQEVCLDSLIENLRKSCKLIEE